MVGVYFHPAQASVFTHVPACELTDQVVALEDLWGAAGSELPAELSDADTEAARIDRLESALLMRIAGRRCSTAALDVPGLAAWVLRQRGRLKVERLADRAGVSRQHLTRVFREGVGVTPKLYGRLARFRTGLAFAGCGKNIDWAQAAVEMGYTDQSHMIAEFREFSSLTPQMLAAQRWFHPFIERARCARPAVSAPTETPCS
jgi:AraC-like DNA-binding protein